MTYVPTQDELNAINEKYDLGVKYVPTLKDFQRWDAKIAKANRPSLKQRVVDPMTQPFKKGGTGRQFGGNLANEVIDMANFLPGAVDYMKQHVVGGKKILPLIPHFNVKQGPAAKLGTAFGYLPVGVGAEKLVAKGLKKLPSIIKGAERISPFAKRMTTSIIGNTAAGALTSPEGERTTGAVSGGIGGALGQAVPELASKGMSGFKEAMIPEAARKYLSTFSENPSFNKNGELSNEMIHRIGKRYVSELNKSSPTYLKIFNDLTDKGKFIDPDHPKNELSSYKAHLTGGVSQKDAYALKRVAHPEQMKTEDLGVIDPFDLHMAQSRLGKEERKYENTSPSNAATYGMGREALNMDLNRFLKKHGKLDDYKNASKIFAKNAAEFINPLKNGEKNPASRLINSLDLSNVDKRGVVTLDAKNPLVENPNIDKIVSDYTEIPGKRGLQKLNILTKHLGGDRTAAINYTKHHLFEKSFDKMNDNIDPSKFISIYGKLSNEQKDALFNPLQQNEVHMLAKAKNVVKDTRSPGAIRAFNTLMNVVLGGIASSHVGVGLPEKMAAFAAGSAALPIAKSIGSRATSAFLPKTTKELGEFMTSKAKAPRSLGKYSSPAAAALMKSAFTNNRNQ